MAAGSHTRLARLVSSFEAAGATVRACPTGNGTCTARDVFAAAGILPSYGSLRGRISAAKRIVHKGTASRIKSRLAAAMKSLEAAKSGGA